MNRDRQAEDIFRRHTPSRARYAVPRHFIHATFCLVRAPGRNHPLARAMCCQWWLNRAVRCVLAICVVRYDVAQLTSGAHLVVWHVGAALIPVHGRAITVGNQAPQLVVTWCHFCTRAGARGAVVADGMFLANRPGRGMFLRPRGCVLCVAGVADVVRCWCVSR